MEKRKTVLMALICPLMLTGMISTAFISMLDTNVVKAEASEITETSVAKIGTEGYESLEDAIDAVQNNETIVVIKDFTYDTPITIDNGKTFSIDFKDGSTQHTFRWYDMVGSQTDKDIFTIDNNSNVTVKNMKYLVGGEEKANRVFTVNTAATLTLVDMVCDASDNIKDIPVRNNGGTVVINGGNITTYAPGPANLLSPVVQNLNNGTTTFTGNGTFTMKNPSTGVAWLGKIITTSGASETVDRESLCGTVIIENGTFIGGNIVDVNGKGTVIINNATYTDGIGPIIKTFSAGVKSNITVNNITSSSTVFAQVIEELNTKIDFQNGNVKYTYFCFGNNANYPMYSVSIANGKFGPKSGVIQEEELSKYLGDKAKISALTDDDGYTYKVETPHVHGNWEISCNDNILTATCGNNRCSETPYSVTLTLNANDEVFSEDSNHKYCSATAIWSDTTLGFPQATLEYYLVTDDGLVLTTNKNSGATKDEDGSAPRWAGNYVVKATTEINETSYTIEKEFSITKAEISVAGFADNIEQPVANEIAKKSAFIFPTQTMYNGEISWSPALLTGNKFDYNTTYTATVTLTANSNHIFKAGASETTYLVDGWTKSSSSNDAKLVYTKTFGKTGKIPQTVTITNDISKTYDGSPVSNPTYTKLGEGVVTIEYKLVSEDDSKYTTTAPTNVGNYIVKVSVASCDTHLSGSVTAEFSIGGATITSVAFTDISTPIANQVAPTSVDGISSDEKYMGTLSWSPNLVDGKFGFDTVYTATVTLTIKDVHKGNCVFADDVAGPNGWIKSTSSTAETLIFTKVFTKTGHETSLVTGKSATCTEDGYKDAYYCETCGLYYEDQACSELIGDETAYNEWILGDGKISASGHETSLVTGKSATCTEDGYKDAYYCDDCGMYFEDADATKLIGDQSTYNTWKLNEGLLPRLLSVGALVGICIGSFFLLLLIIYVLGYFFLYRKGKLDEKKIKVIYKFLPRGEKNLKENEN